MSQRGALGLRFVDAKISNRLRRVIYAQANANHFNGNPPLIHEGRFGTTKGMSAVIFRRRADALNPAFHQRSIKTYRNRFCIFWFLSREYEMLRKLTRRFDPFGQCLLRCWGKNGINTICGFLLSPWKTCFD